MLRKVFCGLQEADLLADNVNELLNALRYLRGVVNKGVLSLLPQSVTVIVDMVTELSRLINSSLNPDL